MTVYCNNQLVPRRSRTPSRGEVLDALLSASRIMVGVAARSLAGLDADVTLRSSAP